MWIWMCILLSFESADTEAHNYPVLTAQHSRHSIQVEFAYMSCDVEAMAFDEFVTDRVSLEYCNASNMDFDMLGFTMPIVSGTSIEKYEFYLENQLYASLSYVEFVGATVKDNDTVSSVNCRSDFTNGVFSVRIYFLDEQRSCKMVTVKVCWSQRPSVFCNSDGVPEKQYVFPGRNYCRCIRRVTNKSLLGLMERVNRNHKFKFSIDIQNVQSWYVNARNKCFVEDSRYRWIFSDTNKDIVLAFTPKEHNSLLVRHFRFQKHYILEISTGLSESFRSSHTASPREVIFVIDMSRYMNQYRGAILIEALERLLEVIKGHKIYVNVVFFNDEAKSALSCSVRIYNADGVQELVEKMKGSFFPRGERCVMSGLKKAVSLERVEKDGELLERNVVLISSGVDSAPDGILDVVRRETRNNMRFFAVGVGKIASYDMLARLQD